MKKIIAALNANPMFHMSLASKELFHSNFLYWLWKLDANKFLTLLDKLLGVSLLKSLHPDNLSPDSIEVKREYQHFDLCVLKKGTNKVLLVIENKVKSIPYVEQLNEYTGKLDKNCKKVLLTLMQNFPDKENVRNDNWIITDYNLLATRIKECFSSITGSEKIFIDHYLEFIKQLNGLVKEWLDDYNNRKLVLLNEDIHNAAYELRLHDLYGKLYYSRMAAELKDKLASQGVNLSNISVSSSYSDQMPLFDVTIRNVIDTETEFIIQVQGTSYRHAVARPNISYADLCKEMDANDPLHNAVREIWWPDGYFIQKRRKGNLGYNKFDLKSVKGCFIYKYIMLVNSSTGCNNEVDADIDKLIEYVVNEVKAIYRWKKEMQNKKLIPPTYETIHQ